jgi:hypothetical protein
MAKQPTSKSGTSRIRFIMLDAEIPDGDLSQITAAIQNALRPTTTIIQQRLPSQAAASGLLNGAAGVEGDLEDELLDVEDESSVEAAVPRAAREQRLRKPTVPKVLDINLTSGTSLESFASRHVPKSDTERNLVVLAWFKEHRDDEAVTANHVYTCYRALKWPSGIDDFSWPLRSLKKDQLATSSGRGQYAINHLGIARVEKMSSAA